MTADGAFQSMALAINQPSAGCPLKTKLAAEPIG
jgi:hypothetical protein